LGAASSNLYSPVSAANDVAEVRVAIVKASAKKHRFKVMFKYRRLREVK
jgi:hypothetical protein